MGRNYAVDEVNNRCKKSIELALLELLRNKPYADISISEISKNAGVSRNAYYRNFSSKDAIIKEYLCDIADDFFACVTKIHTRDYYIKLFNRFKEYSGQLCMLYNAKLVYIIFDVFLEYAKPGGGAFFAPQGETYAAGGMFFLVLRWFENGMSESPEEMAEIVLGIRSSNAGQLS